ncbi:MAG: hypothetical protein R3D59_12900 [Paracoccaceae bacterium]
MAVGTTNAFLFNRRQFRGKGLLYVLMLLPLRSRDRWASRSWCSRPRWPTPLGTPPRSTSVPCAPGLVLVILGQFSFIATIATLVISARLQKFDPTLEEAALNLGADRLDGSAHHHHSLPRPGDGWRAGRRIPHELREFQHHAGCWWDPMRRSPSPCSTG